jgi:hypothetical protein
VVVFKWARREKEYMVEILEMAKRFKSPYIKMTGNIITFLQEQYFSLEFIIMPDQFQEFLENLTEGQKANLSVRLEKESPEYFYLRQNYGGEFYYKIEDLEPYKEKLCPKIIVL